VVVSEVDVQNLVPTTRQFPAQLNLKGVPTKLINKNSHKTLLSKYLAFSNESRSKQLTGKNKPEKGQLLPFASKLS
jgi:hypothetical protein